MGNAAFKKPFKKASKRGGKPDGIANILQSALKSHGIEENVQRYHFTQHWEEIVGKDIAKYAKPDAIRHQCLTLRVSGSSWAQALSLRKQAIIMRVNKYLPQEEQVSDLRFYVSEP